MENSTTPLPFGRADAKALLLLLACYVPATVAAFLIAYAIEFFSAMTDWEYAGILLFSVLMMASTILLTVFRKEESNDNTGNSQEPFPVSRDGALDAFLFLAIVMPLLGLIATLLLAPHRYEIIVLLSIGILGALSWKRKTIAHVIQLIKMYEPLVLFGIMYCIIMLLDGNTFLFSLLFTMLFAGECKDYILRQLELTTP